MWRVFRLSTMVVGGWQSRLRMGRNVYRALSTMKLHVPGPIHPLRSLRKMHSKHFVTVYSWSACLTSVVRHSWKIFHPLHRCNLFPRAIDRSFSAGAVLPKIGPGGTGSQRSAPWPAQAIVLPRSAAVRRRPTVGASLVTAIVKLFSGRGVLTSP